MPAISEVAEERVFYFDGTTYAVRRPKNDEITKGNELYRRTFNHELNAGSLIRDQLDEELRKRKLWSDDREIRYQTLRKQIIEDEYTLAKGGISLSKAKSIAIQMRNNRQEMVDMLSSRTDLDANTCEGRADSEKFNYLFSCCLVYKDTGASYFNSLEDYYSKINDPVALLGVNEFYLLMSELDDVDSSLPENKFLRKYKFTNENHQLVDKNGKLIDENGRHIDPFGNYIKWIDNDSYVKIDIDGREVNDHGEFKVDHAPFLDDDGNPIDDSLYDGSKTEIEEEEPPKPKRRTTKKKPVTEDE